MKANYNNIEKETEKAILVNFTYGKSGWMPKSIVTIDEENKTIELSDWKARDLHIDAKSIEKSAREIASLRKAIAKREAEMTEAEKEEVAKVSARNEIFSNYDAKRREYYAIDNKGCRAYC